jgi:hypothetical protein
MIKWIIIIVALLVFLGYIGFDVRKAVEAPTTQNNITYVKNVTVYVWTKYLQKPVAYLWKEIFVKLIWTPAIKSLNDKVDNIEPGTATSTSP